VKKVLLLLLLLVLLSLFLRSWKWVLLGS
jgi:hypothetical protein